MRRPLLCLALLVVAIAAAACADTTAPRRDGNDVAGCKSGYQSGAGFVCTDSL